MPDPKCKHPHACPNGFDEKAAKKLLEEWVPDDTVAFITGNTAVAEIRRRWPRGNKCPDCGMMGIFYASYEHYIIGDW